MGLKLNKDNSRITVYDEDKYIVARGDELIPIEGVIYGNVRTTIINIISTSLKLKDSDKELYTTILDYLNSINDNIQLLTDTVSINYILERAATINNKNIITYKRAIDNLIKVGIIRYNDGRRAITINDRYNINTVTEVAKYIVIEVRPSISTNDKGAYIAESTVEGNGSVGGNNVKGVGGSGEVESCSFVR